MSDDFELHDYEDEDLLPEYDLSTVERGTGYRPLASGYSVTVHKSDGSTEVREVGPLKDAIYLEADVREYFPDSESVNKALRTIITLFPKSAGSAADRPAPNSSAKRKVANGRGSRG